MNIQNLSTPKHHRSFDNSHKNSFLFHRNHIKQVSTEKILTSSHVPEWVEFHCPMDTLFFFLNLHSN